MIRATVAVGMSTIAAGMIAAIATAIGGMWNRGETRESGREPGSIPSREYEKMRRVAAAWMASAHETKAITTIVRATFEPAWPSDALITPVIGSAFSPLTTASKLGTARMYENVMKNAVAPPISSV